MEPAEELETRILKTLRLIRLFNTTNSQLKVNNATVNIAESERMRDRLLVELRQLIEQYAQLSPQAELPITS
jgi:hypothetical protein